MNLSQKLTNLLSPICPVDGVSIGRKDDKATWRIFFNPSATQQEKDAAQSAMDSYDPAADDAAENSQQAQDDADKATLKSIPQAVQLAQMTPAQIDAWLAANVTDLPSARNALGILAKIVSVGLRNVVR